MDADKAGMTLEKKQLAENVCKSSVAHSGSMKSGKIAECAIIMAEEASHQVALPQVTSTNISEHSSQTSNDIKVVLENESVWSRFHSLGTEMILTKQGRRMFPCCRFRLSGLDPERKYSLVMDIMPLDDFTHTWNGSTWEPVTVGEPHVPGQMCVHPESPTLGLEWMESPVSFYKVKLTSDSIDQDGCLLLRPMHRYQPRLYVVSVDSDSEEAIALDGPNVKIFTFSNTEFYAVTSYQNPQITQLKIDCNPFAMAFREDSQSIRLVQNKLKLSSTVGAPFQSPVLGLARSLGGKRKVSALKYAVSLCNTENSKNNLSSLATKDEGLSKMGSNASNCPNDIALCRETVDSSDRANEITGNIYLKPTPNEHAAPLDIEPSETLFMQEPLEDTRDPVSPISSLESSEPISEDVACSQISCTHSESPTAMAAQLSHSQENIKLNSLPKPSVLGDNPDNKHDATDLFKSNFLGARKEKPKWWSKVKYAKPHSIVTPPDVSAQPEFEDVEGMLFVSFVAKETMNAQVENIKEINISAPPPSPPKNQLKHKTEDDSLSMVEKILKLENILLLDLKRQKHRQVIHPLLQDVGMKLSLLNPTSAVDLQYLGVQLPFPPSVHNSVSSSCDAASSFVSRTGKTSDPTKIKGWKDKFNATQTVSEGLRNSSAFCSDMLDEYLEKEAQHINSRCAVFSTGSTLPVSYQLPSKSTSYVVTLDSRLKSQSALSNKANCSTVDKNLPTLPIKGTQQNTAPFLSAWHKQGHNENEKGGHFAQIFQAHQHATSSVADHLTCSASRPGMKSQPKKANKGNSGVPSTFTSVCSPMSHAKIQSKVILHEMEEEAFCQGKARTHITTKRAKFAITSLLNFQKLKKRPCYRICRPDETSCVQDFCRLGCICDSLNREIRGPTHCRRVQCMFDCSCFKHKVLLFYPAKANNIVQQGRKTLLAFPIPEPEREPRPPPAPSITTLWKRSSEELDPDPVFIPLPGCPPKTVPRLLSCVPHSSLHEVPDEDKDPVYLYFESMMTCARVRQYNSYPPPQIHIVPIKKKRRAKLLDPLSPAGESLTSENVTETASKSGMSEPIKLLEIISECNWEPHRNLVLSALFHRMNSSSLVEPFFISTYKIRLLSTTLKRGERRSTITYKVCVSQAEEQDIQLSVKRRKTSNVKAEEARTEKENILADINSGKRRPLVNKTRKLFSLVTEVAPTGYLKARKKKPGSTGRALIKVYGKTYARTKLVLGQMGALHLVNRYAAFVIGRLQLGSEEQWMSQRGAASRDSFGRLHKAVPLVSDHSKIVFLPAPPAKGTAAPSAKTATSATLSTGQQVVLKPVPGMSGSNFLCQYNGQMIHLMAINQVPPAQPQSSSSREASTAHDVTTPITTSLTEDTISVPKPLPTTLPNSSSQPYPVTTSKMLSLSATSGINITSGTPAFNIQSAFQGKAGMFSFRICPPPKESKCAGSGQGAKPLNSLVGASSTLALPGGFTLVKLPVRFNLAVQAVPAGINSATSQSAELSEINECVNKHVPQDCSPSLVQNCQPSQSGTSTPPKTSFCDSAQICATDLNHDNSSLSSNGNCEDEAGKTTMSVNKGASPQRGWAPKQGEVVHTSDGEREIRNIDYWSPNNEEINKYDSVVEEASQDLSKRLTKASDSKDLGPVEVVSAGWEETETLKSPSIHGNGLPHKAGECSNSLQTNVKQTQHMDASLPASDRKNVHEDPLKNAVKQKSVLDASTVGIKQEAGTEQSQAPLGPMAEQDQSAECAFSNVIKIDLHNKPTNVDMVAYQSDTSKAGLVPENGSLVSSKTKTNMPTITQHLDDIEQRQDPESCKDSPKLNTHLEDSAVKQAIGTSYMERPNEQEPNNNKMTAAFSTLSEHSMQHLDGKHSSLMISNDELHNNPVQAHSLVSTNNTAPQNAKGNEERDDSPRCSPSIAHLPNQKGFCKNKSSPKENKYIQDLGNQPDKCTPLSIMPKCDKRGDDVQVNMNKWPKTSVIKPRVEEMESDSSEEDSSAGDSENSNSDFGDNRYDSSTESETTNDSTDTSSEEDLVIDIESTEDSQGKPFISEMKSEAFGNMFSKRADKFSCMESQSDLGDEKRQTHNVRERIRRGEIQHSFTKLRKVLNIDIRGRMCRQDILGQARLMIQSLEGCSQRLEKKRKALLQRQCAYLTRISELSMTVDKSSDSSSSHTESESLSSVKPEDIVRVLLAQNPSGLPSISNTKCLPKESKPTAKAVAALPKIASQSFCKPDAETRTDNVKPDLPGFIVVSESAEVPLTSTSDLQEQRGNVASDDSTGFFSGMEKTLSELSNEKEPSSSPVDESGVQKSTLLELKPSNKDTTDLKVRTRSKKVVIKKAMPNRVSLGPRLLRPRSSVFNRMATRRNTKKKGVRLLR